jgi:hypothetical protein
MTHSFTPGGKVHHILAHLDAHGYASKGELLRAAMPNATAARRSRKGFHLLGAVLDDGLAVRDCVGAYHLTQAGRDALTALRGGVAPVFADREPVEA